jgi:dipeptide/tripeptide permease
MEQNFAKGSNPSTIPPTGSTGGAILIGFNVFLERFAFYGMLSVLFRILMARSEDSDMHAHHWYVIFMGILSILPIVTGFIVDFFLDKRYGMLAGATCSSFGFTMMVSDSFMWNVIGMSFIAVGTSFSKLSYMSYFGYLIGGRGGKMDGGYSMIYFCINLGAMLAVIPTAYFMEDENFGLLFYLLAGLSLLQCTVTGVGIRTRLFPAETTFYAPHDPKPIAREWGLLFLPVLIGVAFGSFFVIRALVPPDAVRWMMGGFVFLLMMAALVVIGVSAGIEVVRRNLLLIILPVAGIMLWGANNITWEFLDLAGTTDDSDYYVVVANLNGILAGVVALVGGIILIATNRGGLPSFNGTSLRIFLGVVIMVLGALSHTLAGSMGISVILIGVCLMALGEGFYMPALESSVWQLAPNRLKGTAFGLLFASPYLSHLISDPFRDQYDIGALPFIPVIGLFVLGSVAAILILVAFILMRNYKHAQSQDVNPFL